jgi:hypothetical protein
MRLQDGGRHERRRLAALEEGRRRSPGSYCAATPCRGCGVGVPGAAGPRG